MQSSFFPLRTGRNRLHRHERKCDEAGLKGILLYAGGNLVVGKVPVEEIERRYKAMGFDRAFGPGTDPQVTIDCLKKDLGIE